MAFTILCANCGRSYESKYSQKKYCTLACYHQSPKFQAMLQENTRKAAEAARARTQNGITTRQTIECLNCQALVFTKPSRNSKHSKHQYCSRKCYREYMAGRFDRYIASPESLALPQNYDEFLTGEELHCLVEGCGWSGVQLSAHMNFSHGMPKDKFKELAGFNCSTGVVTAAHSEKLSKAKQVQGWGAEHMARLRSLVRHPASPPRGVIRLEGKEHAKKARMLIEKPVVNFNCEGCGQRFISREWNQKYCSVECRDRSYQDRDNQKIHPMCCEVCKQEFHGNKNQKRRNDRGEVVVCGYFCRQKRAGHIARGTWKGK